MPTTSIRSVYFQKFNSLINTEFGSESCTLFACNYLLTMSNSCIYMYMYIV